MPKQQPSLADILVADMFKGRRESKALRMYQSHIRTAEKLIFDDAASYRVGEMLRDIPELLVEQIEFAHPPFELCWVEYQCDALMQGLGHAPSILRSPPNDPTRDVKVGALIIHNRIVGWSLTGEGEIGMFPVIYDLHTEWTLDEQIAFAERMGTSRHGIDLWLWGSVSNNLNKDQLRRLRDTNRATAVWQDGYALSMESKRKIYDNSTGDFKNYVALLLMLNQPSLTKYVHVPRTRGWVGNKHKPFMAHHRIVIALDAAAQIKLVSERGTRPVMRRGGKVRGHYCHNETAREYGRVAGCIHDWLPTDADWEPDPDIPMDEREHWVCRACEGRRWWREEHERSGSAGYVYHEEYNVTVARRRNTAQRLNRRVIND